MSTKEDTKEDIYEAQIFPLIDQIRAICNANGICALATFHTPNEVEGDLCATLWIPGDDEHPALSQAHDTLNVYRDNSLVDATK